MFTSEKQESKRYQCAENGVTVCAGRTNRATERKAQKGGPMGKRLADRGGAGQEGNIKTHSKRGTWGGKRNENRRCFFMPKINLKIKGTAND